MNAKKKRARGLIIGCVILLCLVCILPFPQRIHKSVTDAENGTEIAVSGTRYRYLLRCDRFKGTFTLREHTGSGAELETVYEMLNTQPLLRVGEDQRYLSFAYYDTATNRMENVSMAITGNFEEIEWTADDVQTDAFLQSAYWYLQSDEKELFTWENGVIEPDFRTEASRIVIGPTGAVDICGRELTRVKYIYWGEDSRLQGAVSLYFDGEEFVGTDVGLDNGDTGEYTNYVNPHWAGEASY